MTDDEQTIALTISAPDERGVVAAGLAAARPLGPDPHAETGAAALAVRGQGTDLGVLFFALANDLLAHLDDGGVVDSVRLDGLLRTEDGYTAWGYALGEPVAGGPPIALALIDVPTVERTDDTV